MARPVFLAFVLVSCSGGAPVKAAAPFDPIEFFSGILHGDGELKVIMRRAVPIHVDSRGLRNGPNSIRLAQTVHEGSKPGKERSWELRRTSPTTFIGTLSDATGPVVGRLVDNRLLLEFKMKGGLAAEQVLSLQPDGRTLLNHMTVRKLGVAVAHLDEVIVRVN
jgi:hypothetical protein